MFVFVVVIIIILAFVDVFVGRQVELSRCDVDTSSKNPATLAGRSLGRVRSPFFFFFLSARPDGDDTEKAESLSVSRSLFFRVARSRLQTWHNNDTHSNDGRTKNKIKNKK